MIRFEVHVRPGSRSDAVRGTHSGALIVRVRAQAVDGAANDAVTHALADAFSVTHSRVTLLRGRRGRRKFIEIAGEPRDLEVRLAALMSET